MVKKKFVEDNKKYNMISDGEHMVLGLSGGPDSLCLFFLLKSLRDEFNLKITAVHINHNIRGKASDEDEAFVRELCKKENVNLEVFSVPCLDYAKEHKLTAEEAGRELRYKAFSQVAEALVEGGEKRENIKIAVAHNMDDRCETLLFRMMRGTGIDGLSSIAYRRLDKSGFMIVRPLLSVSRKEIESYLQERNIEACIDLTNLEEDYTRNKIRLRLLPLMEEFNPRVKEAIIRLANSATQARETFDRDVDNIVDKALEEGDVFWEEEPRETVEVKVEFLKNLDENLRQRVLGRLINNLGLDEDLTAEHFSQIENIIFSKSPSARCFLPRECIAFRRYNILIISKETDEELDKSFLYKESFLKGEEAKNIDYKDKSKLYLDYDKMAKDLGEGCNKLIQCRKRSEGDHIYLKNLGDKKLKKLLIDCKVPRDRRDEVLILACGKEVLWVKSQEDEVNRKTGKWTVDTETKSVICLEFVGLM